MKKYISNKDESARMFSNNILESLTHVHPSVPLIIFIPVILYFLYHSIIVENNFVSQIILFFIFGMFVWTLTEYLLHRFVFHLKPTNKIKKRIYFMIHGVHHEYPNDSSRLVMVPVVSIPLSILFYIVFYLILGDKYINAFFPGFLTGYLFYDMIHYATHHFKMKGKISSFLKKHHMKHHYKDNNKYFGVSSPLWDYIFKTY